MHNVTVICRCQCEWRKQRPYPVRPVVAALRRLGGMVGQRTPRGRLQWHELAACAIEEHRDSHTHNGCKHVVGDSGRERYGGNALKDLSWRSRGIGGRPSCSKRLRPRREANPAQLYSAHPARDAQLPRPHIQVQQDDVSLAKLHTRVRNAVRARPKSTGGSVVPYLVRAPAGCPSTGRIEHLLGTRHTTSDTSARRGPRARSAWLHHPAPDTSSVSSATPMAMRPVLPPTFSAQICRSLATPQRPSATLQQQSSESLEQTLPSTRQPAVLRTGRAKAGLAGGRT
jgi:hypothetical protein